MAGNMPFFEGDASQCEDQLYRDGYDYLQYLRDHLDVETGRLEAFDEKIMARF